MTVSGLRLASCCFPFGFIAAAVLASAEPAEAQGIVQDCRVAEYLQPTLEALKSADKDQRISAARTLVEGWRASLPNLIREIETFRRGQVSAWEPAERQYATIVTDTVKTILASTDQAIQFFRQCDNDRVIKRLAWAARGEETALRINAANILANATDNTTICFVLHHLRDPSIDVRGRANLLGVAVAVAGYAYSENVKAIDDTLKKVAEKLSSSTEGLAQTQKLMNEVDTRAKRSSNGSTPLPESLKLYCKDYRYDGPPPE